MKAKLLIDGKEIEVEISEEEYKKIQTKEKKTGYEAISASHVYYYDSCNSCIEYARNDYGVVDSSYYEVANYYSSKTVAGNNARADKLMRQLRRFAVEHRELGINFNNANTKKYYIYYDYDYDKLNVSLVSHSKNFGAIYFDSEETAQAAIGEFHDELIWYFTEYKDSL